MFRHLITTIDYPKLMEIQANEVQTRISQEKSKSLKACQQTKANKVKTYNLNNSVKRHH